MISQHWFGDWLGALRQQAITWKGVDSDQCRHMASLGHNELKHYRRQSILILQHTTIKGPILFPIPKLLIIAILFRCVLENHTRYL